MLRIKAKERRFKYMPMTLEEAKREYRRRCENRAIQILEQDGFLKTKRYTKKDIQMKLKHYFNAHLQINPREGKLLTYQEVIESMIRADMLVAESYHKEIGGAFGDIERCDICGVHLKDEEVIVLKHARIRRKDKHVCKECAKKM